MANWVRRREEESQLMLRGSEGSKVSGQRVTVGPLIAVDVTEAEVLSCPQLLILIVLYFFVSFTQEVLRQPAPPPYVHKENKQQLRQISFCSLVLLHSGAPEVIQIILLANMCDPSC